MKITRTQLRQIIREELRKKPINEDILDIIPYFRKKKEAAAKAQADKEKKLADMAYSHVKNVYDDTVQKLQDPKYDAVRAERIKGANNVVSLAIYGDDAKGAPDWGKLAQLKTNDPDVWIGLNEFGLMDHIERSFTELLKLKKK